MLDNKEVEVKDRGRWAPYAPASTVKEVINHFRERDVPEQIDKIRLTQIGVSEGLLNKVWATLEFLGLIREDGTTTELFHNLRYASDQEYPVVLLGILKGAYADIFAVLDPENSNERDLDSAFRPYSPGGQRNRMITLFVGLSRDAGLITKVPIPERGSMVGGGGSRQRKTKPKVQSLQGTLVTEVPNAKVKPPDNREERSAPMDVSKVRMQYIQKLIELLGEPGEDKGKLMDRIEKLMAEVSDTPGQT